MFPLVIPICQRFNPRLPGGRRRSRNVATLRRHMVSIHAFRGEGDPNAGDVLVIVDVSIHAFRGEGDLEPETELLYLWVSIHAFRGEGDNAKGYVSADYQMFQSTPSGGKATGRGGEGIAREVFQSTPSGGKATPASGGATGAHTVSIHAFRGEGDWSYSATPTRPTLFQSTPSGGKATQAAPSIRPGRLSFNPRLPGGRRPGDNVADDG